MIICSVDGCDVKATRRGWCGKHYKRWRKFGEPDHEVRFSAPIGAQAAFIKLAVSFTEEACLFWPYGKNGVGYGMTSQRLLAHRVVCEAVHGTSPEEKPQALHSCGNGRKGCVNPNHLRWGSASDNERDKVLHGTSNRGARHGMSKLTEENVHFIRKAMDARSYRDGSVVLELAEKFSVDQKNIREIGNRRAWHWLPEKD